MAPRWIVGIVVQWETACGLKVLVVSDPFGVLKGLDMHLDFSGIYISCHPSRHFRDVCEGEPMTDG